MTVINLENDPYMFKIDVSGTEVSFDGYELMGQLAEQGAEDLGSAPVEKIATAFRAVGKPAEFMAEIQDHTCFAITVRAVKAMNEAKNE